MYQRLITSALLCLLLSLSVRAGDPPVLRGIDPPRAFVMNAGQWDARVSGGSVGIGPTVSLSREGYVVALPSPGMDAALGATTELPRYAWPGLRLRGMDADCAPRPAGDMLAPLRVVDDKGGGAAGRLYAAHEAVLWRGAWPGVDVRVAGSGTVLRHDIAIAAGADPSRVKLRFDRVTADELRLRVPDGVDLRPELHEADGGVDVTLRGSAPAAPVTITVEWVMFLGGANIEYNCHFRVDDSGLPRLVGLTYSPDFPVNPPAPPPPQDYAGRAISTYVTKLSADGKSVVHSRLFSGAKLFPPTRMETGPGGRLYVILNSTSIDSLLTDDALLRNRMYSASAMIVIDYDGLIEYASYLPSDRLQGVYDLAIGGDASVYLLGHTYDSPPMATSDAIFAVNQGIEDAFIMKLSGCEYALEYGSCFGGTGHEEPAGIAVADDGRVAVVGPTLQGGNYPLVKPWQAKMGDLSDFCVSVFAPDLRTLEYSTYLGGKGSEGYFHSPSARQIAFDSSGHLYLFLATASADFPLVRSLNSWKLKSDIALCKFDRNGTLVFSTLLNVNASLGDMLVEPCGKVLLSLEEGGDSPELLKPVFTRPVAVKRYASLWMFDTNVPELLFATWFPSLEFPYLGSHGGSVFLAGLATADMVPATPGYPGAHPTTQDIVLTRLEGADLCTPVARPHRFSRYGRRLDMDMQCRGLDTLRVDDLRKASLPGSYRVDVVVHNRDTVDVDSVTVQLSLPAFLRLPSGGSTVQRLVDRVPALDSVTLVFDLAITADSLIDKNHIVVIVTAGYFDICNASIRRSIGTVIEHRDLPYTEISCAISTAPTPSVNVSSTRLASDSLQVTVRVQNHHDRPAALRELRLGISPNSGLLHLAPLSLAQPIPLLPPRGSVDLVWHFRLPSWLYGRDIHIEASVLDTFGLRLHLCETDVHVPGAVGTLCSTSGPETVFWDVLRGTSDPDSIRVRLMVENPCDTIRFYRIEAIDFTRAPHLALVAGEKVDPDPFFIRERFRRILEWRLRVQPPLDQPAEDTLRFVYRTLSDSATHVCDLVIPLRIRRGDVRCMVLGPDSLTVDASGTLSPADFEVSAILHNAGTLAQDLSRAVLVPPGDASVTLLDAAAKGLRLLQPGESDTVRWQLRAAALPVEHNIPLRVQVFSADELELTSCSKDVFVPAVEPRCTVSAPDTLRYNVLLGVYERDSIRVQVRVDNPADVDVNNIVLRLDTAGLRRSRILSAVERTLPRVDAHGSMTASWWLEPLWAESDAEERYEVEARSSEPPLLWHCAASTLIQGGKRDASLQCFTAGHDTVWADAYYEALIPDPIQVQYTLRNSGSMLAGPCSVALLPPPMYALAAGEDSIRALPALAPGEEASVEWMLDIVQDSVRPGNSLLRFVSDCAGAASVEDCEHVVTFAGHSPDGLVLTPWLLRFAARRNDALPASRTVLAWTGGGPTPSWTIGHRPSWLGVQPLDGSGRTALRVQPTTTDLPLGMHKDVLELHPAPLAPGNPQVYYHIEGTVDVTAAALPGELMLGPAHPHPLHAGESAVLPYQVPSGRTGTLRLHDILGRELWSVPVSGSGARGELRLDGALLSPGLWLLSLHSDGRSLTRRIVVLR
ncbi:MAG TPA: hypothetical protein PK916_16880 [Bacteroidota bacterium]|nr:hypothetical protein [Bacteroidota bacterium]